MSTHRLPILNYNVVPDGTGNVWAAPLSTELALASAPGNEMCIVMPAAATISSDTGIYGKFTVPNTFAAGSETLVIRGILDGAPSTLVIAFGVQLKANADDESYDQALGAQAIASASSVSQADEDVYEETIDISGTTFAANDDVNFFFYIDDSVHTYTGLFLLTGLFFQYTDA